jgi:hypothetical protein
LVPAITPKKPSMKTIATTAKYCSELLAVRFKKYVPIKAQRVVKVVMRVNREAFIVL